MLPARGNLSLDEIGGGKINLSGNVGFAKLTAPTLDLTATAKDVLAARDDNLTARVNADVRINGPLATATVSGHVGLTKSRYLKDIDIVPINMPGKPAPAPPASAPATESGEGPGSIGVEERTMFAYVDGVAKASPGFNLTSATPVTVKDKRPQGYLPASVVPAGAACTVTSCKG